VTSDREATAAGPRRLHALVLFTVAELLLVSLDPLVSAVPAVLAFAVGSLALLSRPAAPVDG
jgi:hypothetical protein